MGGKRKKKKKEKPSYVDAEVPGGAEQRPARCQRLGDVFQRDGRHDDPHGETDHQEAVRALEGPAVSRMDVRLRISTRGKSIHILSLCKSTDTIKKKKYSGKSKCIESTPLLK